MKALMDGLDFLSTENLDTSYCKSILLLSGAYDDYNGKISPGDIVLSARKNNTAVYTIDFPRMAGKYETSKMAIETYAVYTKADPADLGKYTDSLKNVIKNMSLMASGSYYTLKYKTAIGPGNIAVSLKLSNKTGNESSTLNYNTPSYPAWIFSSVLRILVLVLIMGLIIGLAVFFVVKNRKKQQLAKAETEKKLSEIEENNRRAEEENKKNLRDQEEKFRKENEAQRLRQQQEKEMQERKLKDNESLARLQGRNRIPTLVDMSGNVYNLANLVTKIGRIDGNDLVIQDNTVSKNHAVIMYERQSPEAIPVPCNEFFIVDLGSANGTLINNMLISGVYKLKDGDIIRFGNISASFRS
jgi:pSer/pThr/pTyr-binding forkhead associated (FHA) protein